jgi:hypothetical protein
MSELSQEDGRLFTVLMIVVGPGSTALFAVAFFHCVNAWTDPPAGRAAARSVPSPILIRMHTLIGLDYPPRVSRFHVRPRGLHAIQRSQDNANR